MSSQKIIIQLLFPITFLMGSCNYLEVAPKTSIPASGIFKSASSAEATVLGMYYYINNSELSSGMNVAYLASLSSDELVNYNVDNIRQQFYDNALLPNNTRVSNMWSAYYQLIYRANEILEGLVDNQLLDAEVIERLGGEAYFMRAYAYFYLVNFFGEVPLSLSTNYRTNSDLPKCPEKTIYDQIISDLKMAQQAMPPDYSHSSNQRIRVNRSAATAMLARVYLYTLNYQQAEEQASAIIEQNGLFKLESDLSKVYLTGSSEAIWQLQYYNGNSLANPAMGRTFIFSGKPTNAALSQQLINSFSTNDRRLSTWIGNTSDPEGFIYYYSNKYRSTTTTPVTEYMLLLRLAEQYLIRAEARARTQKVEASLNDLNVIRNRAGIAALPGDSQSIDEEDLLKLIDQERQRELFFEDAHRWFDLKRTGRTEAVLSSLKPQWRNTAVLFPIPESQLINSPAMHNAQNMGY